MLHAGNRRYFNDDCIVKGHTDSFGCFTDVHYTQYNTVKEKLCNQVRKQAEKCDYFDGFDVFTSLSGGGMGSAALVDLQRDFSKKVFNVVAHAPDPYKNCPNASNMEMYNFQANIKEMIEYASLCTLVTNKQLANYCTKV
jgi:tubulin beta